MDTVGPRVFLKEAGKWETIELRFIEDFFNTEAAVKRIRHHKARPLCLEIQTQAELCAESVTQRDMEGTKDGRGVL